MEVRRRMLGLQQTTMPWMWLTRLESSRHMFNQFRTTADQMVFF